MRQLALDLPHQTQLGLDDFVVSAANASAHNLIMRWPDWPAPVAVLVGPAGSGKSHLAEVWRKRAGAVLLAEDPALSTLGEGFAALADNMPGALSEASLFHLINHARERGGTLLIATRSQPAAWAVALPDLASRLKAAPVVEIGQPDDALLRNVLAKLFHDRQIRADEAVLSYLLVRMPRSLEAARNLVAAIDRYALEQRAEVTRALVARVLARLEQPGLFDGG